MARGLPARACGRRWFRLKPVALALKRVGRQIDDAAAALGLQRAEVELGAREVGARHGVEPLFRVRYVLAQARHERWAAFAEHGLGERQQRRVRPHLDREARPQREQARKAGSNETAERRWRRRYAASIERPGSSTSPVTFDTKRRRGAANFTVAASRSNASRIGSTNGE